MAVKVDLDVDLNYAAIVRLTSTTTNRVAHNAAQSVQARARRFAPVETGRLRESIAIEIVKVTGEATTYKVQPHTPYAGYQEWGTGPIYPTKPGGVLVFKPKGSGTFVFARRTSGVPATHYMTLAGLSISIMDFKD